MNERTNAVQPARVDIGGWLNQAWEWFVEDLAVQIVICLVALLLWSIPVVGWILFFGPISCGLALIALRRSRGEKTELPEALRILFDGFQYFLPSLLATILISVFVLAGLIFLILPGLVILAMYQFTFHFIAIEKQDFWQAMESSRRIVAHDYAGFTLLLVLLMLINFLGSLFFVIGLLISIPVTALTLTAAYRDFSSAGFEPSSPPSEPIVID